MIKYFITILLLSLIGSNLLSNENQIEITTDEGIEVFQNEKYYLLKKNVEIITNNFVLSSDLVKVYFKNDLYDIVKIECSDNVKFKTVSGIIAKGNKVNLDILNDNIEILGNNSELKYNNLFLFSNELIFIDRVKENFKLRGEGSMLDSNNIKVIGSLIFGSFSNVEGSNEISTLEVTDEISANIITEKINMFSMKAIYSKKNNIIELFDNVKIKSKNELILGDNATINTVDNSYKISSNGSQKVKILINNE